MINLYKKREYNEWVPVSNKDLKIITIHFVFDPVRYTFR